MKFKIGDIVYIEWVDLIKVQIIKLFPNTNRYQILQGTWKRYVDESKLYSSEEEYWLKEIEKSNEIIKKENYKICKAELIIRKLNEVKNEQK